MTNYINPGAQPVLEKTLFSGEKVSAELRVFYEPIHGWYAHLYDSSSLPLTGYGETRMACILDICSHQAATPWAAGLRGTALESERSRRSIQRAVAEFDKLVEDLSL